jgi:hypothetical protein
MKTQASAGISLFDQDTHAPRSQTKSYFRALQVSTLRDGRIVVGRCRGARRVAQLFDVNKLVTENDRFRCADTLLP